MINAAKKPATGLFEFFFKDNAAGAEMLHKINGQVPSIMYVYDAPTKKVGYINNKVKDILGLEFEEMADWDGHLATLVFKDDTNIVNEALEKCLGLSDNETHTFNNRFNHKEGNYKYFKTTGSVLKRNDKGEAETFLFIAEDITQSIETEQEVKLKKQLIDETEALLQFGTWAWDAATGQVTLSDGMLALMGATREETVVSNPLSGQFITQEDADALAEKVKQAATEKREFEHTYNLKTKTGQQKIVSTNGRVVLSPEGNVIKVIGTTRDVTEQENAYRELFHYKQMTLEKERFLESGSWEVDFATGNVNWSEGMYGLFGYDIKNDIMPASSFDFYFSHFPGAAHIKNKEQLAEILKGKDYYVREELVTAKNGVQKWLETYVKVLRKDGDMPFKVMGATKDISRLKEYERQLEKKLLELERSNKALEEFAYVASHDLQEPLRKISTFSERIQLKFEKELGDEGRGYLSRMLSATANMRMLIENLLNFSRLTLKAVQFEEMSLSTLLEETLTEIELQIDESNTTVIKQNLPVLHVIPSQIKQLFSNIILNAVKFKKAGVPPVINIACTPLTQDDKEKYQLQKHAGYYAISISDNGIGFEPEYAEKIFQIFQRLHGKAEYPGAGIGLAICRKIAENHHGKLFADSKPGDGAVFTVILPEKNN